MIRKSQAERMRCNICRGPLPGRLPREIAADRCTSCQLTFWDTTRGKHDGVNAVLSPEQLQERNARIERYASLAACGLPLFAHRWDLQEVG